jgi:hypothetical protein
MVEVTISVLIDQIFSSFSGWPCEDPRGSVHDALRERDAEISPRGVFRGQRDQKSAGGCFNSGQRRAIEHVAI